MNKTCSVLIMTYNGEKYICEQLQSIVNQTVLPNEIIVCDDCSKDNTVRIIKNFMKNNPKIRIELHINSENIGIRKNAQIARGLCTKDVVFICDQDDVWMSNKIEVMLKCFDDDNVVFAFSDGYVTDEDLNVISESEWTINWTKFNTQQYFDYCQTRNFPLGHVQVIRRDVLLSIEPFLSDVDSWQAQCAPAFGKVKAVSNKLVYYRRNQNAASSAFICKRKSKSEIIKNLFKIGYQEHFTWPKAEFYTYSQILKYVDENNYKVKANKLLEHLEYLDTINNCEQRGLLHRIKMLNKLYKQGVYQKYRGNKNTLRYDKLFMCVNSLSRK